MDPLHPLWAWFVVGFGEELRVAYVSKRLFESENDARNDFACQTEPERFHDVKPQFIRFPSEE
jgi:hypothetical protein